MLKSIGRISKTYGNRGGVVLEKAVGINPADLEGKKLFIAPPLFDVSTAEVERALVKDKRLILFFREIKSLDQSRKLVGRFLQLDDKILKKISSETEEKLTGFEVFTDDGTRIGIIKDDLNYPAHKVLQILLPGGKEILIPYVDRFVVKVDKKGRKLYISGDEYKRNWEE